MSHNHRLFAFSFAFQIRNRAFVCIILRMKKKDREGRKEARKGGREGVKKREERKKGPRKEQNLDSTSYLHLLVQNSWFYMNTPSCTKQCDILTCLRSHVLFI
jgi:hypothetical protein